jgi:3-demethoxyubiquinol 3-hydroxylase
MQEQALQRSRDARTVARILKVNHAGEHGAIRIYRAQIGVARWRCPDVIPVLAGMLGHEVEHHRLFQEAMPARNAKPCRALFLWAIGGWLLGFMTALAGRTGIWACTAAVELAVHRHLEEQLLYLGPRDPELYAVIQSIKAEEQAHLDHAEMHLPSRGPLVSALRLVIAWITEALIFASTSGDSLRLSRDLARELR